MNTCTFNAVVVSRSSVGWHVVLGTYSSNELKLIDSPIGKDFLGNDALSRAIQFAQELKKFFEEILSKSVELHFNLLTAQEVSLLQQCGLEKLVK